MLNLPLRFEPFLRPMVWGGRRLGEVLGKRLPTPEPYGESWEISSHPLHLSTVAEGHLAGRTLQELWNNHPSELLGLRQARLSRFPWLIKFLDAHDWLSVQVHPDDEIVQKLCPGEGGKSEAWVVIDAEPGSRIYSGLLPDVNEGHLRAALRKKTLEECLHHFEPQPGDCLFLPAGTVHAVGGGVLIAEVQQSSDATFRLYDWNRHDAEGRSRPLHIEASMAAIEWGRGPVEPARIPKFSGVRGGQAKDERQVQALVESPYFHLKYVRDHRTFSMKGDGRMRCFIVLSGEGDWQAAGQKGAFTFGQTWLMPACMESIIFRPNACLELLFCELPPLSH